MADNLKQEIESNNQKFMDAFAKQDPSGIAALYTEDCKIMPQGVDVMMGKDSVARVFKGVMDQGNKKVKLSVDEVGPMGTDTVYERSHFAFYDKDEKATMEGKYVVIWKKINGTYYMYIDIFNSNSS